MRNGFWKGHALGNDYLALDSRELDSTLSRRRARALCDRHRMFPERCNLQLATRSGPHALEILIWERGAGETSASGTSACAVACAAIRLGLVSSPVLARSAGGKLSVSVGEHFEVTLEGAVDEVARGTLAPDFVRALK